MALSDALHFQDYRSSALLQCMLLNIMQDMPKMFKVTCACIPDVQADPDRAAANAGLCTKHLLESDLVAYYDATSIKNMAAKERCRQRSKVCFHSYSYYSYPFIKILCMY